MSKRLYLTTNEAEVLRELFSNTCTDDINAGLDLWILNNDEAKHLLAKVMK